jgi:YVTN family beta-propeller protein
MSRTANAFAVAAWMLGAMLALAVPNSAGASQPCGTGTYPFPYTDVSGVTDPFCPGIMEAYVTGVSKGTSPTMFSPNNTVTRVQMTTFLQRSLDQGLTRASRRAALNQWWTPQTTAATQAIAFGASLPSACAADGESIWTSAGNEVVEVQGSSGALLGTWTGATASAGILAAAGKIFVAGQTSPGKLYVIDPTQPPAAVTVAASTLGDFSYGIAFDGTHIWTANQSGSVSIITPQSPYTVTTVSTGFSSLYGILYDGKNIWVTDFNANTLLKLDSAGAILQTVPVGTAPYWPVFDGANIWVPGYSPPGPPGNPYTVTVVQASTGNVVATLTGDAINHLHCPRSASFDGERILVTNWSGDSVTVFKAADLSVIANVATPSQQPYGACSDGVNFWFTVNNPNSLVRF